MQVDLHPYRVDARFVFEHVEAHSLRQRPALSDRDDVPLLHVLPAGRAVHRHVLVALLEPVPSDEDTNEGGGRSTDVKARPATRKTRYSLLYFHLRILGPIERAMC